MRRRGPTTALFFVFFSLLTFAFFSLYISRSAINRHAAVNLQLTVPANLTTAAVADDEHLRILQPEVVVQQEEDDNDDDDVNRHTRHVASVDDFTSTSSPASTIDSVAVLLPDWEVLVIVSHGATSFLDIKENYTCRYPSGETSDARFAGALQSTSQKTFKCSLPTKLRRRQPFPSPLLTLVSSPVPPPPPPHAVVQTTELLRFSYLVYESFSTENDVVLFVKGVNHRQGVNRRPSEFMCVFSYINGTVKTAVTSSMQEVFRCHHPKLTDVNVNFNDTNPIIKVSLEIPQENNRIVPSVAYYTPPRQQNVSTVDDKYEDVLPRQQKSLVCACTMVYNVGKFLREWVLYHSRIGVGKFIIYDNNSDDDLASVVHALKEEGYDIETIFWIWPKTQEAGFSHGAVYAKDRCTWMMYVDVDEFVFSPSWLNASSPSDDMIKSLLPKTQLRRSISHKQIGQVSIKCNDFGPSNQVEHPLEGVTQGYNCRRKQEQRHKSIVLLDAVDHSLLNVVHHFEISHRYYRWKDLSLDAAVINHYKYQAWSEFKTKFRRRVSAYVQDWQSTVNPKSKDRTPGLGFEAVEPKGWAQRFCEIHDERLKVLTRIWFGLETPTGYKMAWQR